MLDVALLLSAEERGRVNSLDVLAPLCHQPPAVGYLDHSNTSVMVILVWAQGIPGPSVQNYFIASHPLLLLMHGVIPSHIALVLSFMWFPFTAFSSLLISFWMASHLSYQPPSPSFVLSAKGRTTLKNNMYFYILSLLQFLLLAISATKSYEN